MTAEDDTDGRQRYSSLIREYHSLQSNGVWAALAVHSMVIMVGMTLGFSAILLPQLEESDSDIQISRSDASWLASVVSIVAPIGALSAGPAVQWLGSKKTIAISMVPFAIGWMLISFANGLPMLLIGRIVTGLSNTFGNTPCIVYITEVSSPHMRPMLTTTGPTISSLGVLLVYVLGWLYSWRTAALVPAAWSLVCLAALFTVPESPVWLASRGRLDEARKAIYWFYKVKPADLTQGKALVKNSVTEGKTEMTEDGMGYNYDDIDIGRIKAEEAFAALKKEHSKVLPHYADYSYVKAMDVEDNSTDGPLKKDDCHISNDNWKENDVGLMQHLYMLFFKPTGIKPLVILAMMFLLQQYAGVYITLFYAVNVFKEMGGGAMNAYVASILVGLVRFTMSLVNIWLFRKFGRRPLCLLSTVGMAICMLTSGTSLYFTSIDEDIQFNGVVNFNTSHDHFSWTSQDIIHSTPQSLVENTSAIVPNHSISSNEQENLQSPRHFQSFNEAFSNNLTLNSLNPRNFSNHSLVDNVSGHSNHTDDRLMEFLPSSFEESVSTNIENNRGNELNLEQRKTSYGVTTPGDLTLPVTPHISGSVKKSSIIPTICMLLYVCVSMVGLLAIPWTMTAELFPTEIRGLANSVVLSLAHLLLFSGLQVYPSMLDALGPHGVLWMFAAVSAVSGIFVYFFLPETYGKSLDEIETYFAENTVYTYPCKRE
ncbi:facilitated trehalose transporter Tret1-2 homolog isoform X2 [Ischnura elegans]|uniref:facilitated trehalose transporter Tret1-2 homolog isoform X2 n=1 Tax=Ischnura elegans TaxID=197161 RepID=UPI001ED8B5D2|nr:facilitated trehalose transporter Tret1-2 homolog isoform X2 [Ischnura elegans]